MKIRDRIPLEILKDLREDHMLEHDITIIDSVQIRAFGGGEETGPSPVDRRKPGSKITLMTDLTDIPLAVTLAGSNRRDHREILPIVRDEFPKVGGLPGAPKKHPKIAIADAGYDSRATRDALEVLCIQLPW